MHTLLEQWPLNGFIAVLGLCVGSFLNVLIYRLPRGKSVVSPGSACPSCGHPLSWWENIPVLSFVILRGRCRSCNTAISFRYPLVEIITGLVFFLVFSIYGMTWNGLYFLFYASILVAITFIDIDHKIIPDSLSLGGLVVGLVLSPIVAGHGLLNAIIGALFGGGLFFAVAWSYYLVTKRVGLGGGDIKLLSMIGAFLGPMAIPAVVFLSALTGSLMGLIMIIFKKGHRHTEIPYGPFLAIGGLVPVFYPNFTKFLFSLLQ